MVIPPAPPFLFLGLQAIRGCPTSWSYWSDLGWCYHTEGKQAAALKAYTRAEELLAEQQPSSSLPADGEGGDGNEEEGVVRAKPIEVEHAARVRVRTQVGEVAMFTAPCSLCDHGTWCVGIDGLINSGDSYVSLAYSIKCLVSHSPFAFSFIFHGAR